MRVRISARQSDLARLQAYRVGRALEAVGATEVVYQFRSSLGDLNQTDPLWKMPEKGVFTEDFVRDLTEGTADMVVHSWKDLPTLERPETEIVATLPRADTRDLLLIRRDRMDSIRSLGRVTILTSSPRRAHNLREFLSTYLPSLPTGEIGSDSAPASLKREITFEAVRGNIPTRLKKMMAQDVDGLIVAKAALDRLLEAPEAEFKDVQLVIREILSQSLFMVLPLSQNPTAAAQGALAIEILKNRPELAALVARFNCVETFSAVSEERRILASYGGGCHQKIGVTVLNRGFGRITYLRGLTDQGECLDRVSLNRSAGQSVSANGATRVFPEAGEDGTFFDRETLSGGELEIVLGKLSGADAIFVSRENALPKEFPASSAQVIWASGLKTWEKLAARGIWVSGCAEGLGESEPANIDALVAASVARADGVNAPQTDMTSAARFENRDGAERMRPLEWIKVSHEDAGRLSGSEMRSVATYRLKPKSRLPDLRDRTHFYWMSGSSFERAAALFPEIKNQTHASGPGHTHRFLVRTLGEDAVAEGRVQIALDLESWRQGLAT